jgi:hypothetical protein
MVASITTIQSHLNFLENKFSFITVIPKWFNCAVFSRHLLAIIVS